MNSKTEESFALGLDCAITLAKGRICQGCTKAIANCYCTHRECIELRELVADLENKKRSLNPLMTDNHDKLVKAVQTLVIDLDIWNESVQQIIHCKPNPWPNLAQVKALLKEEEK